MIASPYGRQRPFSTVTPSACASAHAEQLARQATLPDAGVAIDRDELRAAGRREPSEDRAEELELLVAADHRRTQAWEAALGGAGNRARLVKKLDRRDRPRLPPHRQSAYVAEGETPRRAGRALGDEDLVRIGGLLEPRRCVDGVAGDDPGLGARLARGDDVACVHADPHREADAVTAVERVVQLAEAASHPESRPKRPRRVVLVRDRRAEDGHHRVADELLDGSAFCLDLLAHGLGVGAEHVLEVFRVQRLAERRRPRDVRKEHGHDPALGRARGPLGRERPAAARAEAGVVGVLGRTGRAGRHRPTSLRVGLRQELPGDRS